MNLTRITRSAEAAVERATEHEPPIQQAALQAHVLAQAAMDSTSLYCRTFLARLAREWVAAAVDAIDATDDSTAVQPVITAAAGLAPGALVYHPTNGEDWCSLVRTMTRDGQVSLHLEDAAGRPIYVNLTVAGSPVVVAS